MQLIKNFFKKNRYFTFAGGGVSIFLVEYTLTFLLTEVAMVHYRISYSIALLLGMCLHFLFHNFITFKLDYYKTKILAKFLFTSALFYVTNLGLFYLLTLKIYYMIAIPIIALPISIIGYSVNKNWVFR